MSLPFRKISTSPFEPNRKALTISTYRKESNKNNL